MTRSIGIALAAASALLLSGCAGTTAAAPTDGPVPVVASTDVYGQIAQAIGGDDVAVTSLIDSGSQDPHSFEARARDQLAVSRAALVIENGGGYDPFMASLVDAGGTDAPVITAVDLLDDHAGDVSTTSSAAGTASAAGSPTPGLNEHVWYDPQVAGHVAAAIADELSTLRPHDADTFAANLAAFQQGVDGLGSALAALKSTDGAAEIFVTEPVPLYLTDAAGLVNVAPDGFTEAVEEGRDVPPATLLASLDLVQSGDVRLVIVNAQTGGAETQRVTEAAASAGVPVVPFTETLPEGKTYLQWMSANVQALSAALAS